MRYLFVIVLLLTGLPALAQEPRFEAGAQIAVLDLRNSVGEKPLGIGGRFGYNATNWLTAESELSYFPQNPSGNFGETLAVFGPKVGCRFSDVPGVGDMGVFFKARPGVINFGGPFFTERNVANRTKFAFDVGVVWERYFRTYGVFRIDIGDVIIPFGDAALSVGSIQPVYPHTSHNLHATFGVGVRF